MATRIRDAFGRPDGPLGTADSGQPWRTDAGTAMAIRSRTVTPPVGSRASLDAGLGGNVGEAVLFTGGTGLGVALVFRLLDAANYWMWSQRGVMETYQSGTRTVATEEQYIIGFTTTPVEYEWVGVYTFHGDGDAYGMHTTKVWGGDSQPGFPYQLGHMHYQHPYTDPNSDTYTHYHSFSYAYKSGATRGGESVPIYGTRTVYTEEPVYSTRLRTWMTLERVTGGVATKVYETSALSIMYYLRVSLTDTGLTVTGDQGGAPIVQRIGIEMEHAAGTRYGIGGIATESNPGTVARLDYTPPRGGLYVPSIMP